MVFASGVSVSGYVCMVAGCGNTVYARGLCRHHYDRDRYAGSPIIPFRTRLCPIGFSVPAGIAASTSGCRIKTL